MKMGRRLRDAGEASWLCCWEEAKRGRFAHTSLSTAHFDRNAALNPRGDVSFARRKFEHSRFHVDILPCHENCKTLAFSHLGSQ